MQSYFPQVSTGLNITLSHVTYQVTHKAEVGHREESSKDVEQHAVQRRHVDHHKVHVDCTNHQDDDTTRNLPHPEGKQSCVSEGERNIVIMSTCANLLRDELNLFNPI